MTRAERAFWVTAYHEAGHAVVAFHEALGLRSATVIPADDTDGMVTQIPLGEGNSTVQDQTQIV
jgi:ATP-dependent Zn protease